ncbi:MAG: hypothetical protein DRI57_23435 [Deltaproteobacteria bacterium]|nr:MAG: hypothetical protein DRI57_23435 [Deltaproteobacteria bacterium]
MACDRKRIVIFGSLKNLPEDSRNNILIMALEELGWDLASCIANWGFAGSNARPVTKILTALLYAPIRWLYLSVKYLFVRSSEIIYVPYSPHVDAWLACLLTRLGRRRIIIDAFMGLYDTIVRDRRLVREGCFLARLIWMYEKYLLRSVDLVLVDTREHAVMLQQEFDLPKQRVVHIPVGIDEMLWQPTEYPSERNVFNVVFWTTFIPLHGVEVVAEAAKILENESQNIRFLIIGNGQLGDRFGELLKTLKPGNLMWTDRFLPLEEIQKYVEKAHCCLGVFGKQLKTQRVIPYKVSQTTASARPLITARTDATEQIFSDTVNALLVTPGDPEALAYAIKRLADDREMAVSIGRNGREVYESRLSNRVIKNRLDQIIRRIEIQ